MSQMLLWLHTLKQGGFWQTQFFYNWLYGITLYSTRTEHVHAEMLLEAHYIEK